MTIGGVEYLLSAAACAEHEHDLEGGLEQDGAGYYVSTERTGEAPGVLRGSGVSDIGLRDGQHPTEEQARRILAAQHPDSGEWLGTAVRQQPGRDERMRAALAGLDENATEEEQRAAIRRMDSQQAPGRSFYDVTLSPDKTISTLYAAYRTAGQHELADQVLAAHNEAVEQAMSYLEQHTYTRTGHRAERGATPTLTYEHAPRIVRMDFQHTTSRATDPHLHTHAAVVNRVQSADGKWRAVHGAAWRQAKPAAASIYENKLAELVEERTPARFISREDGRGRQIAGIDPDVLDESSQRTRQVLDAQERATAKFRHDFGRDPEPHELRKIHRLAGLESRDPKSGRSPDELLAAWSEREGIDADKIVRQVHETGQEREFWGQQSRPRTDREVVREAVAELQHAEAHWTASLLRAYIAEKLPLGQTDRADELARQAVDTGNPFGIVDLTRREPGEVPRALRNEFDAPRWRDPSIGAHALSTHLADEVALAAQAATESMPALDEEQLAAVEQRWSAEGVQLNESQRAAVLGILGSRRGADAVVAAAGSGKSHTAGVLTGEWHRRGGTVHGVTTSQIAAHVLVEHGLEAMNSTLWLMAYEPDHPAAGGNRLASGDCVVLDEANMTSTAELRRIQRVCDRDGAKLVLMGDPAQLSAVGAGGALAEIARRNGAFDLPEPLRFHAEWEREASKRLRDGDVDVLDEYLQQGRIHGGTQDAMRASAVDRYCADVINGDSSLLVTATNAEAAQVSQQVQHRLAQLGVLDANAEPFTADMSGLPVYLGDRIQWRHNVYDVDSDDGREVVNREYLQVAGQDERGRVQLERQDGSHLYVPSSWLSQWAQLGYAVTEHGAEGVTVDHCHALTAGYVAMTRGRATNEAWLTTAQEADAHEPALDTSAREQFSEALAERNRARSAIQHWRDELDAGRSAATLSAIWEQSMTAAVRERTDSNLATHLAGDDTEIDTDSDTFARLCTVLTRAELSGHSSDAVLDEALDAGDLTDARDVPAVLAARAERRVEQREPERAAHTWTQRAAGLADATDASELGRFTRDVGQALDVREAELAERVIEQSPEWAMRQLGELPPEEQELERAEWQHAAGRIAAYRERLGIADAIPSIGARPHDVDVHQQVAWYDAARSAGREVERDRYLDAPDTDLEANRARWRRVCEEAPAYVADDLAIARQQQRQAEADAVLLDQQADAADGAERAESLRTSAQAQRDAAAVSGERVAILDRAQAARDEWQRTHEPVQDRAREAERELWRRGRIPDSPTMEPEPEQGALFEIGEPEPDKQQPDRDRERQAEEPAVEPEPAREVEPVQVEPGEQQAELFAVEHDPREQARNERAGAQLDDDEPDRETSTLVSERQAIADAADAGRTLREVEQHTRWAEEVTARRKLEQQERAQREEQQRAERDRRMQPETAPDLAEQEIPLPDEPEPDEPELEL